MAGYRLIGGWLLRDVNGAACNSCSGAGVSPADGSETAIGLSTGALGPVSLAGLLSIVATCGLDAVIVAVPLLPSASCQ